jgi:hypothetical protein
VIWRFGDFVISRIYNHPIAISSFSLSLHW